MANKLKNMRLTSVDLVARGANQEADICLFKGMDSGRAEDPHTEAPKASQTVRKTSPSRFVRIEEFP